MQRSSLALSLLLISISATQIYSDDLTIEKVGPLEDVGRLDPVGQPELPPIDPVEPPRLEEAVDPLKFRIPKMQSGAKNSRHPGNLYVPTWTPDVTRPDQWEISNEAFENKTKANDFAYGKKDLNDPNKKAYVVPVEQKVWESPLEREKFLKTVKQESIPHVLRKLGILSEKIELKTVDIKLDEQPAITSAPTYRATNNAECEITGKPWSDVRMGLKMTFYADETFVSEGKGDRLTGTYTLAGKEFGAKLPDANGFVSHMSGTKQGDTITYQYYVTHPERGRSGLSGKCVLKKQQ